jgi:hypothetical protein
MESVNIILILLSHSLPIIFFAVSRSCTHKTVIKFSWASLFLWYSSIIETTVMLRSCAYFDAAPNKIIEISQGQNMPLLLECKTFLVGGKNFTPACWYIFHLYSILPTFHNARQPASKSSAVLYCTADCQNLFQTLRACWNTKKRQLGFLTQRALLIIIIV